MATTRLEAFSDGVLAIILTIMVLELKVPHEPDLAALVPMVPTFFGYLLSFLYIGIYWNNHHHLFHAVERIGGGIMWANLGLLFCLSLVPVVTGWVGEHPTAAAPSAAYGVVLFASALAWRILEGQIVRVNGADSDVARRLKRGNKSYLSPVLYTAAIGLAFVHAWIADAMYLLVALLWIVPDRPFEPEPGEPVAHAPEV